MPKHITILALLCFFSCQIQAQEQESIYSEWLEGIYPTSYQNVKAMVERVWGTDENKVASLVELHAEALSKLMDIRRSKDTDDQIFSKALDMWSLSSEDERLKNWWEWPNTNWMKVLEEYNTLTGQSN